MTKIKDIQHPESVNKQTESVSLNSQIHTLGINGDQLIETRPWYIQAKCEKVVSGQGDASIVFGRDRPYDRLSGYGGKGHTKSNSIDMVVGRLGQVKMTGDEFAEPDFVRDACRIHISQKSDPDRYFNLAKGSGSHTAIASISLKSDAIRIMSRDGGIKLVTNIDKVNSRGNSIVKIQGVDLIAGNDDSSLQYTVAGENTLEVINKLIKHIEGLNSIIDSVVTIQSNYNKVLSNHYHLSPFFGKPTTPSFEANQAGIQTVINLMVKPKKSLISHKMNLANLKQTYCSQAGSKYILSRYNKIN